MRYESALVAAFFALQLCVAPVLAKAKNCGNNVIDPGEQCDGTADSGCPGMCSSKCQCPPVKTFDILSKAKPADTPGSKGVKVKDDYPQLIPQFGTSFNLNKARYTRFQVANPPLKPDAILILIPGFEGGAANFRILAQNLLKRIYNDHGNKIEVWAFDRRTHQLEDTAGLDVAEKYLDPMLGINWLFGAELGLAPNPKLPRRVVNGTVTRNARFYNPQNDIPFLANWTNLVFSQDIDAVVNAALMKAKNKNVFLGGHSAGTAFTARYASTDFNITPSCTSSKTHPSKPGYAKLRGLVLLEGGGGSTAGGQLLTADSLDRMIAAADGGLFGAVRDNVGLCVDGSTPCTAGTQATDCVGQTPATCTLPANPGRCVDGITPCTIATEATACAGQTPPKCTLPTTAYSLAPGLNPRLEAQSEALAIQGINDPNTNASITLTSGAEAAVPDLSGLTIIPPATVEGGLGFFLDKDGFIATYIAQEIAMSLGEPGPTSGLCVDGTTPCTGNTEATDCAGQTPPDCVTGTTPWRCADATTVCTLATEATDCAGQHPTTCTPLYTWADIVHDDITLLPSFGPQPTTLSSPLPRWGADAEVTRIDRLLWAFFAGKTNFSDWYYPNAGPSTTSVTGVCTSGTCTVGNVSAACSTSASCSQAINLDSTLLSSPPPAGRGRCDIENLTQASKINIPVIAFSGSQGLATVPGVYTAFAQSIAPCTTSSHCNGTPRVIDPGTSDPLPGPPNPAFPVFGDVAGGFEVHVNVGYAHLDVLTAEDNDTGYIVGTSVNANNVVGPLSDFINRNIQ
jgi:pimeloyl-ACP methyl ester carboxylesterase